MILQVKDLLVGDEVIVGSQSNLQYLTILRPVRVKRNVPFVRWERKNENKIMYSSVYVSTRKEETMYTYKWNQKDARDIKKSEYICSPSEHNIEKYIDLNYKTILLIKRK